MTNVISEDKIIELDSNDSQSYFRRYKYNKNNFLFHRDFLRSHHWKKDFPDDEVRRKQYSDLFQSIKKKGRVQSGRHDFFQIFFLYIFLRRRRMSQR